MVSYLAVHQIVHQFLTTKKINLRPEFPGDGSGCSGFAAISKPPLRVANALRRLSVASQRDRYGAPSIRTATLPLRKMSSGGVVPSVSITAGETEHDMFPKKAEQGPVL